MKLVLLFSVAWCSWSIQTPTDRRMEEQSPGRRVEDEDESVESQIAGIFQLNAEEELGNDIADIMGWIGTLPEFTECGDHAVVGYCSDCPQGNGSDDCKGECIWMSGQCIANAYEYDYMGEGGCTDSSGNVPNYYAVWGNPNLDECLSQCTAMEECLSIRFTEPSSCRLFTENGAPASNASDEVAWLDLGNEKECSKFFADSTSAFYQKRSTKASFKARRRRRKKHRQSKGRRMEDKLNGRRVEDKKLLNKLLRRTTE